MQFNYIFSLLLASSTLAGHISNKNRREDPKDKPKVAPPPENLPEDMLPPPPPPPPPHAPPPPNAPPPSENLPEDMLPPPPPPPVPYGGGGGGGGFPVGASYDVPPVPEGDENFGDYGGGPPGGWGDDDVGPPFNCDGVENPYGKPDGPISPVSTNETSPMGDIWEKMSTAMSGGGQQKENVTDNPGEVMAVIKKYTSLLLKKVEEIADIEGMPLQDMVGDDQIQVVSKNKRSVQHQRRNVEDIIPLILQLTQGSLLLLAEISSLVGFGYLTPILRIAANALK